MSNLENRLTKLQRFYGTLSAPPRDPFILFVWEVLAVHSTPRKSDAALNALKRLHALTPDSMWKAPAGKLEAAVRQTGPYLDQRMEALRKGIGIFRRSPQLAKTIRGPLPAARRALKPLPQLGEAGAHRMLLFAADHPVLPVDARVNRVGVRLGYGPPGETFKRSAKIVQRAMSAELPLTPESFRRAFLYVSHHGAATCTEREPHCSVCPLLAGCPEGERRIS